MRTAAGSGTGQQGDTDPPPVRRATPQSEQRAGLLTAPPKGSRAAFAIERRKRRRLRPPHRTASLSPPKARPRTKRHFATAPQGKLVRSCGTETLPAKHCPTSLRAAKTMQFDRAGKKAERFARFPGGNSQKRESASSIGGRFARHLGIAGRNGLSASRRRVGPSRSAMRGQTFFRATASCRRSGRWYRQVRSARASAAEFRPSRNTPRRSDRRWRPSCPHRRPD